MQSNLLVRKTDLGLNCLRYQHTVHVLPEQQQWDSSNIPPNRLQMHENAARSHSSVTDLLATANSYTFRIRHIYAD